MLLCTGAEPELIHDSAMFQLIDSGIRGGVSMITTRYAKANNPQLEGYDPSQPTTWIKGLDANNLYGYAMSEYLPLRGFKWVPVEELRAIDWTNYLENGSTPGSIGYILKVDLKYPADIHDRDNDFPFAPERLVVQEKWKSAKQIELKSHYNLPRSDANAKLIPNLMDKKEYVIHYRLL